MVYHGVPWYTMVNHGNPWYTVVYTMVCIYPRDVMLARVFATVTCLSVCHDVVLCQNEES